MALYFGNFAVKLESAVFNFCIHMHYWACTLMIGGFNIGDSDWKLQIVKIKSAKLKHNMVLFLSLPQIALQYCLGDQIQHSI